MESEKEILSGVEQKARVYGVPVIRTESHKILEKIVADISPKHILEIGTAVGYSGITMLSACSGDLVTIEHNGDLIAEAKKNFEKFGLKERVKIISGDCHIELAKMLASGDFDEHFDFIFLDGPKAQYNLLIDGLILLLARGGTLVADNVLFRGYVEGKTSAPTKRYKTIIKRLNEFIQNVKDNPKLTDFEMIDIEDGMIKVKKK